VRSRADRARCRPAGDGWARCASGGTSHDGGHLERDQHEPNPTTSVPARALELLRTSESTAIGAAAAVRLVGLGFIAAKRTSNKG
jgi:hypothetical protein